MTACRICSAPFKTPLHHLAPPVLTSICEVHDRGGDVWFCEQCSHLQTTDLADAPAYYQSHYQFHTHSSDEDRILIAPDGTRVFETEFRAATILDKIDFPQGARVLDFGCGKAATLRHIVKQRPDLEPHLFDVTEAYLNFWGEYVRPENWSVGTPNPAWKQRFDVVLCLYAAEHMVDPAASLAELRDLVKPGGVVYLMAPDVYANPADFVVIDHTHHYSGPSLHHLIESIGMSVVSIDATTHHSAFIAIAKNEKPGHAPTLPSAETVAGLHAKMAETAAFWSKLRERIIAWEAALPAAEPIAIYGAGFYGSYVFACLRNSERVVAFIDRNPHLHGRQHLGRPVIPPVELAGRARHIVIALNPSAARNAVDQIAEWREANHDYFYL